MIGLVKLTDIFYVEYGNHLDLNKQHIVDDGINFVNRSSKNLGVSCKIRQINKLSPFNKGLITVALGGSILAAYVQPEKFYTGQNVKVLKPKKRLSHNQKVFYCLCINKNAYKYSTCGREANKTFNNLLLPCLEEIPEWVNKIELPKEPTKEPYHYRESSLTHRKWKYFRLKDIFTIEKGTGLIKDFDEGSIPLVSSTSCSNGVTKFVDKKATKLFSSNFITVSSNGSVGESFYQPKPFYATSDLNVLIPKFHLNEYIAMFLNTMIRFERYRFSYGRKWGKQKMLSSEIKLPVTKESAPDWGFMEYYIKSLPYSKNLEDKGYRKPLKINASFEDTMKVLSGKD